ncbi:hypothetical protein FLAG1_06686 [Fusarium langsethiae]|uniref:Uncharacterized protein n=1 Tax=Fusarium langsethiae TaxID=179993 RepID=A0A0N0V6I5_FUSLA|nr:hypothetical protein FLAG1_06686 [Fusarium langsethiae]GKU04268.1 unnamed protein product [Fusarium langsethiae]GKU19912.1 unnamed protein product [Fusarium langsethiae]
MSSSLKRMFSTKKDTAPSEKSYTMDDYKKENEELKRENKSLHEGLNRTYHAEMDALHDMLEQTAQLESTLRELQQLGEIYDRKGIEKVIKEATREPDPLDWKTAGALKKVKIAEQELVGAQENLRTSIDTLKSYLKQLRQRDKARQK